MLSFVTWEIESGPRIDVFSRSPQGPSSCSVISPYILADERVPAKSNRRSTNSPRTQQLEIKMELGYRTPAERRYWFPWQSMIVQQYETGWGRVRIGDCGPFGFSELDHWSNVRHWLNRNYGVVRFENNVLKCVTIVAEL